MSITSSMREYLATIYHLQQYEYRLQVDAVCVAAYLEVSSPAVTRMLKRLEEKELVVRGQFGVDLTLEGTAEGAKGLRWQRILECFLFEKLGFKWHELHDRARKMLSGVDDEIIEKMAVVLNDPKLSPYGESIPPFDSLMPRCEDDALHLAINRMNTAVISRIRTHDIEIKTLLEGLDLTAGTEIYVARRGSLLTFDRKIFFHTDERDYFLPEKIMSAIWVKEADYSPRPIDGIGMYLWSLLYLHNTVHGEAVQIKKSRGGLTAEQINEIEAHITPA